MVRTAWARAFAALIVRLALAAKKTNTAQDRATIAATIIMPKMMYVARHAWPTQTIIREADWRVRNFVWNSSFASPLNPPKGWISADIAELPVKDGGIGLPNITTELIAMAAMAVGEWSMSSNELKTKCGHVLRQDATNEDTHITPIRKRYSKSVTEDMWSTGQPLVTTWFGPEEVPASDEVPTEQELRKLLRHRNGLKTRWGNQGLRCEFIDLANGPMEKMRRHRRLTRGDYIHHAVGNLGIREIQWRDALGTIKPGSAYRSLLNGTKGCRVKDIIQIIWEAKGIVTFSPVSLQLPMTSSMAHKFRELCLSFLAQFPELAYKPTEDKVLRVSHGLDDPHHQFWVDNSGARKQVMHGWSTHLQKVAKDMELTTAIAASLDTNERQVWIVPHPWLTGMQPLWAGRRRWAQTRKGYKKVITKQKKQKAHNKLKQIAEKGARKNKP
ncbi:secreted peptide, putative, partial [Phytophthora infestans T30-4]